MSANSYKPGDRLVYGSNGVCVIESITPKRFANDKAERLYYILKPINSHTSTLFVPLDNETLRIKMREVITKPEITDLLSRVKNSSIDWIENRGERLSRFQEILRGSSLEDLVQLIGCIYDKKQALLDNSKHLSATDANILSAAEKLVNEEFSYVLSIPQEKVSGYIHSVLTTA